MLNRIVRATADGIEIEADQRHAEIVVRQLQLEDSNGVVSPWDESADPKTTDSDGRDLRDHCDPETNSLYKSITARFNYLSMDRPDLQYAVKELCRNMSAPTWLDWAHMRRVGRYLAGKPRLVIKFEFQGNIAELTAMSDANWAGCKETRKITSGGCLLIGKHLIKSWSKTQHAIATSSAESEGIALVKTTSEAIGLARIVEEFTGNPMRIALWADASAALGMLDRVGSGKVRHVDVGILWLQQKWLKHIVNFSQIPGQDNYSNLMTKGLGREQCEEFMRELDCQFRQGRAGKAVKIDRAIGEVSRHRD